MSYMTLEEKLIHWCQTDFGRRLLVLREKAGLSKAAAARAVGISQGYWWNIERGNTDPSRRLRRVHQEMLKVLRNGEIPTRKLKHKYLFYYKRIRKYADAIGVSVVELMAPLFRLDAA